jgi:hypothetical protein
MPPAQTQTSLFSFPFTTCRLRLFLFLVDADMIKRKLPSLLVDASTNSKKGWKAFMRYRFENFKKRNPEKFNSLMNKAICMLTLLHRRQKRVHAFRSIFSFALLLAIRKTDRIGRLLESAFRILDRIFLEHFEFVDLA